MPEGRLQRTRDNYNPQIGIAVRFVRLFDAEDERVDSLKRAAAEIRHWWGDGPGFPWNTIEGESH